MAAGESSPCQNPEVVLLLDEELFVIAFHSIGDGPRTPRTGEWEQRVLSDCCPYHFQNQFGI